MSHAEIIADLKSRGERNISFFEDGSIISLHGVNTVNYWAIVDNKLVCVNCRTIY
jgi:hypothetical protein